MQTVELVLSQKIPRERSRKFLLELGEKIRELSSGLDVKIESMQLTKHRMPNLHISGDDEEAFTEVLRRSFGLNPRNVEDALDLPIRKAHVQKPSSEGDALLMDMGFDAHPTFNVTLRLDRLRAQLLDGRPTHLQEIISRFGFFQDFPLELRVISCNNADKCVSVELSDGQRNLLNDWRNLPFDRITLQDALETEILHAIRTTGLERDVAAIENLSFSTQSVVCKLGTDGQGLVRKLGAQLNSARIFVFHPDSAVFARRERKENRNLKATKNRNRVHSFGPRGSEALK